MKVLLYLFALLLFQDEIPYKPSDEFQLNVDLKFKEKISGGNTSGYNQNAVNNNGERLDKPKKELRAFLSVSVTQLKIQSDEAKIIVIDSQGTTLLKKKASADLALRFNMGFVEDLKNNTSANEITVFFLSPQKKELRKIVFAVSPTGIFAVNGQWRGQF